MAITTSRVTYEDLESIPQAREGDRHEIINGELVVSAAPTPAHQFVSENLGYALGRHVREQRLGKIAYSPIDIRLAPDNVLNPDIVFIARDRLHIIGPKTVDAPPDLVVEILSPGTRQRDLAIKRDLYARFGGREYWIVDPATRSAPVLGLAGDRYEPIPPAAYGSLGSRVLPSLSLPLAAVFAECSTRPAGCQQEPVAAMAITISWLTAPDPRIPKQGKQDERAIASGEEFITASSGWTARRSAARHLNRRSRPDCHSLNPAQCPGPQPPRHPPAIGCPALVSRPPCRGKATPRPYTDVYDRDHDPRFGVCRRRIVAPVFYALWCRHWAKQRSR